MKIVVNSHKNSTIALNHLLDSMRTKDGFEEFEIIIVIGGYYELPDYKKEVDGNLTYIYCNHNSIDWTALIYLLDTQYERVNEYYFYMHDTSRVGDRFFRKLQSIDLTNATTIRVNGCWFSMNIGIYSQRILNSFAEFLNGKRNRNEADIMKFKIGNSEDYIFRNDPNNRVLDNFSSFGAYTGPTDYYNTGTPRIVEYFPNVDLYKIKANWGTGTWTLEN